MSVCEAAEVERGIARPYSRDRSSISGAGCRMRWIVEGERVGERSVARSDGAI